MHELRYYVAADGRAEWFANLDAMARAKVARGIARMAQGNLSNAKPLGATQAGPRVNRGRWR
jgi:hypothetical protein